VARVYDLLGHEVAEIARGSLAPGRHELAWDGRDARGRILAAGVYVVEVRLNDQRDTRRVVITR
jgi:flagellar hook assembly protein FlgD